MDRRRKKSSKPQSALDRGGDDDDLNIFEEDRICLVKYCRDKTHYHPPRKQQQFPQFSVDSQIQPMNDIGQGTPFPLPLVIDRKELKFGAEGQLGADKKVVVTELALDHWLAQNYNLNIDSIPPYRPQHIPNEQIISPQSLKSRTWIQICVSQKQIPQSKKQSRPNKLIRNRLKSENIRFLSNNEIEQTASVIDNYYRTLKKSNDKKEKRKKTERDSIDIDLNEKADSKQEEVKDYQENIQNKAIFKNRHRSRGTHIQNQSQTKNRTQSSLMKIRFMDSASKYSALNATAATLFENNYSSLAKSFNKTAMSNISKDFQMNFENQGQSRNSLQEKISSLMLKSKTIMNKTRVSEFKNESNQVQKFRETQHLNSILNKDYGIKLNEQSIDPESSQLLQNYMNVSTSINKAQFITNKRKELDKSFIQAVNEEEKIQRDNINQIIKDLELDIDESRFTMKEEVILEMQEFKLDFQKMQSRIQDMKSPNFWLQKAIQQCNNDSVESSIDYYKQGLRVNPTSEILLYNLACQFQKIGKFENSIRWLKHSLNIKPQWTDAYYGLAITKFKMQKYDLALKNIELAIETHQEQFIFIHLFQCSQLMNFCAKTQKHVDNKKYLSSFFNKQKKNLEYDLNRPAILELLSQKSFFKRLSEETIDQYLTKSQIVKYEKDDLIFLNKRVGIITNGSVSVRNHTEQIMKPRILCKALEGQILGYDEIDKENMSTHSQTWLVALETTEIVFFKKETFKKIWDSQRLKTSNQIALALIEKNLFFSYLSKQSLYFFIYEGMKEIYYYPGQLIAVQSLRSVLNKSYLLFYQNIVLDDELMHTIPHGEIFGKSFIIKHPSYEYFGDIYAGENGVTIYFFDYELMKRIPVIEIQNIIQSNILRKKDGIFHMIASRFKMDISELKKY
ncbi:tpr domain containing protein [Stylonychia lemnae]|uniref:Tpr domain containing protein n=1 Tax=Stylonychia lemnae TaxID=5949 RepID=A0A078AXU6_STYLE|nr:tpr domain containing protein [Stylonychia lemnae]|eukprot:CDW86062.1 tpr domain containing protein [Stylonychia lemnae]